MSGIVAYLCISPALGGGDGQLAPHERGLKLNYVLYMHSQTHMYPPKHKHTHTHVQIATHLQKYQRNIVTKNLSCIIRLDFKSHLCYKPCYLERVI